MKEVIIVKFIMLSENDFISLVSYESNDVLQYKVKGIFKTKYAYQKLGSQGTTIIKDGRKKVLEQIIPDSVYYTFHSEVTGQDGIRFNDELKECNYVNLPTRSVVMVNVVFPCLGLVLILATIYREIHRTVLKHKRNFAILVSQGVRQKEIVLLVNWMQGVTILIAIIIAIALYKYVLMQRWIGHYISMKYCLILFLICMLLNVFALWINSHMIKNLLGKIDLIKLLYSPEESE